MEEIIVHQYKIRFKGDYYRALVTGSKYEAEKYFKNELKADEVIWEKSFVTTKDIAIRVGTGNKTIARQGFFLRMEFLCQMGTKRNKPLADKSEQELEAKETLNKFLNGDLSTIPLALLRKSKRISTTRMSNDLDMSRQYLYMIEKKRINPSLTIKDMIANYLEVSIDDIEWDGEEDND